MTVWDNVAFGPARPRRSPKAEIEKRVDELLEIVRLGDFAQRKPAQLSGGQQQRVALARALVNYPSALLLDEPLGALDLKLRQAMQLELKRIQREVGITFIFVTHDQEEALTMSDRIAVMSEGRVEQIGSPEEIYHEPETVFVAGFIGMANLLPARDRAATRATSRSRRVAGDRRRRARRRSTGSTPASVATLMIRPERMHLQRRRAGRAGSRRCRPRSSTSCSRVRSSASTCAAPRRSADRRARRARGGPAAAAPGRRVWAAGSRRPAGCCAAREHLAIDPDRGRDRIVEAESATTRSARHEQP